MSHAAKRLPVSLIFLIVIFAAEEIVARPFLIRDPVVTERIYPDLVVSSFNVKPEITVPGRNITLCYSIKNSGKVDVVKKDINYSIYISKNRIFDPSDIRILSIDKHGFTLKSGQTILKKGLVWCMPSKNKLDQAGLNHENSVCFLLFVINRKNTIKEVRKDNNIGYSLIRLLKK